MGTWLGEPAIIRVTQGQTSNIVMTASVRGTALRHLRLIYHYLQIGAFNHHQKIFLLQQMGTNTETYMEIIFREWETLKQSALKRLSSSNSSPQGSGNSSKEEAETSWETERIKTARRQSLIGTTGLNHIRTHRDHSSMHRACTGLTKRDGDLGLREMRHKFPLLVYQKLSPIDDQSVSLSTQA